MNRVRCRKARRDLGAEEAELALCHFTVIRFRRSLKAFSFMSSKCPCAIYEAGPFSADLLPLLLWPTCSSPEISFEKGNFCVAVKFMTGCETPGINSAVGLVSVPGEKSSFSIVYSLFLYMSKFQIVQSDATLFSVVKGYHIITKHIRKGFGQRLPACNPCTCIQWRKQQKGQAVFLMPQISRPKGISMHLLWAQKIFFISSFFFFFFSPTV